MRSDHLDIGCQPNGDHVLLQALAGHDVAEAVVDDNVERSRPEFRRG
jgi:hypothetical protein